MRQHDLISLSSEIHQVFLGDWMNLETVQMVDVFPDVKLTSGRRLVIIDSSVDEVARLEADRKEHKNPCAGFFDADRLCGMRRGPTGKTVGPGFKYGWIFQTTQNGMNTIP